ncbi:hypothetical protein ROG8370_00329 [Roseovarius gaetbuli]|uniref:Uncharacterized protein n=1 Tax=Roseovarius gaetbuli TaxID=1356575 RepID=A0A1X6Y9A6_9RHOB|nr:hypothetical protein [Roseovarius gaetbuli]SLN14154.1 hypothetical protein ROG8370_00329 [Roseovarius gaetbuli]
MVALPDLPRDFKHAPHSFHDSTTTSEDKAKKTDLRRAAKGFLGSVLLLSAAGVWLVSAGANDAAMMLIKLVFSVSLFCVGAMCFSTLDPEDIAPEVQIDTKRRQLRVIETGIDGRTRRVAVHELDDLAELSLRDQVLTARDFSGRQIVALPVNDRATERALRRALSFAA